MDNKGIQSIEQTLQVVLPEDYKQILLDYPPEILDAKELHLSDDATWLIEQNLFVRKEPSNFFGKEVWYSNHFVIGEDGNGNCFYLNLEDEQPSQIYFLDHEQPDESGIEIAHSFAEWILQVRAQLDEYKKNAERRQEYEKKRAEKAQKAWWKFWGTNK